MSLQEASSTSPSPALRTKPARASPSWFKAYNTYDLTATSLSQTPNSTLDGKTGENGGLKDNWTNEVTSVRYGHLCGS
jgi:hypothetical protein